jgi:arginine deiminase
MPRVNVTSEIGPLRAVLVHTPGNELLAVTPGTREDYLYDDIINVEIARREHQRMVAVLQRFAEVLEVRQLLAEVLEQSAAREFLIGRTLEVVPSDALARQLSALPTAQLVTTLVEGVVEEG